MIKPYILLCSLYFFINFLSCVKEIDVQPVIIDFNPKMGSFGSEITIKGINFDADPQNTWVSFSDSFFANIKSIKTNEIVAIVPQDATKGKINVTINYQTTSSKDEFFITNSPNPNPNPNPIETIPIINNILPSSGKKGDLITINGQNFGPSISQNTLYYGINQNKIPIENASTTIIQFRVPSSPPGVQPPPPQGRPIPLTIEANSKRSVQNGKNVFTEKP